MSRREANQEARVCAQDLLRRLQAYPVAIVYVRGGGGGVEAWKYTHLGPAG